MGKTLFGILLVNGKDVIFNEWTNDDTLFVTAKYKPDTIDPDLVVRPTGACNGMSKLNTTPSKS